MNRCPKKQENGLASCCFSVETSGLSRREFLAQAGRSGAAAVLATCTPWTLSPSLAQAEAPPAKSADELIDGSATTLAKAIRDKKVSSAEVLTAYLQRIEQVNPQLHAVVQLTVETARAQAREADAVLARGEVKGPLHGVPFTVKDTIETVGVVCTSGTKGRESFIPTQDATTVARLRAAGAVLLGKTNVPEFGLNMECENLVYGKTNNPYLPTHMPGGSSGGEAAILAAGGSPVGLGSQDLGLSAHYCGITSLKPTTKRAPMTGHVPFPTFGVTSHQLVRGGTMWQIGPMARFVADLSLVLPLIVGEDGLDPNMTTMPLGNPEAVELKRLRAAFYTDNGIAPPTPETVATLKAAAKALTDAGLAVEETSPGGLQHAHELFMRLTFSEPTARWVEKELEKVRTTESHPWTQWFIKTATPNTIERDDLRALGVSVNTSRSSLLSFLQKYDVVLCPVSPSPAPVHQGTPADNWAKTVSYLATYAMLEVPTVVVRCGVSPEGLPIGVQIVTREWREDVALAVAQHIETALGGWRRPSL